jgi:hypothetical protein
MLRGKFTAVSAYIKKDRSLINSLIINLKLLEKQEQAKQEQTFIRNNKDYGKN